jgi:hypothetical protein
VKWGLIDDFADAVLAGREPKVTARIGRAVAVIEEQIYAHSQSV